jgi:hypothetical protein
MLRDFEAAAASMLLFLKNVEEIEIYTRPRAGADGSHAEGSATAGAAAGGAGGAVAAGAAAVSGGGGGGGGNELVRVGRTRVAAAAAGGEGGVVGACLTQLRASPDMPHSPLLPLCRLLAVCNDALYVCLPTHWAIHPPFPCCWSTR